MPTTPPARHSIPTTIPPPFSAATPHTARPACSRGGVIARDSARARRRRKFQPVKCFPKLLESAQANTPNDHHVRLLAARESLNVTQAGLSRLPYRDRH